MFTSLVKEHYFNLQSCLPYGCHLAKFKCNLSCIFELFFLNAIGLFFDYIGFALLIPCNLIDHWKQKPTESCDVKTNFNHKTLTNDNSIPCSTKKLNT